MRDLVYNASFIMRPNSPHYVRPSVRLSVCPFVGPYHSVLLKSQVEKIAMIELRYFARTRLCRCAVCERRRRSGS